VSAHQPFQFHNLDELRAAIAELGVEVPVADDPRPLLEPVSVGSHRLANRLVVLPMEGCDGLPDGAPGELTFRRYRRFAAGGASLLWMEATAVVEEGRANPRQLWIHEETVPGFAALALETRRAAAEALGPSHRPLLILQLTHSGRYSRPGRAARPIIAHHSKFLDPIHNLGPDYPLISDDELERLEDRYVEAARCALRAGFDGVDVKACHRYLVSELLASHTREGRYGGSFENRTRFLRNVVGKIRAAVPGLLVTSRMNAHDAMAYPYGFGMDRDGSLKPDLSEPVQLVRFLEASGAPLVNITIGNPYFNPHVNRPFDLPVSGAPVPPEHPLEGVARFLGIVRAIQSAFPEMAVVGGGYSWLRQYFPHVAAAAVRQGWVTLVGAGRMAFAYPDFARDLAQRGRLDGERVCVACSACTQIMRDGGRTGCVPRDAAVYEPIYKAGRAEAVDTIRAMAATCRQCNDPTCVTGCPAQVEIPKFVGHIAAGRFREAYETLRERNILAAACGYVCPSETLCESECINRHYTETVPIRHLQRWVGRKAVEEGWAATPFDAAPPTGKRVAVIGAGPAGVAASVALARLGHSVTLIDRSPVPGGTARATIPAERLPGIILSEEIRQVLAVFGDRIERRTASLGASYTLDHVFREGFSAVLLALGLSRAVALPGAARPASGVAGALEFLERIKSGERVSGAVLVLGGGNTAIDAALSARRAGAADVSIVYRRSFAEMPAWPGERDEAIRGGVNFLILTQPLGYETDAGGRLTGLKVVRTRLGEPGPDGRRRPQTIPGSEHVIPADLVVEAIGQRVDPDLEAALTGVRFTPGGLVERRAAGSYETTRPGAFAAGDLVNGGTTVVQAVAEGGRAAHEIDAWLRTPA
jgi:NADPH-dependent glutamate synthase beta subunit-like oxidoreductase/2,4-dienoyl-CoA reductase-like NADH-dependent reductase (Old Yellow Enzyme family)